MAFCSVTFAVIIFIVVMIYRFVRATEKIAEQYGQGHRYQKRRYNNANFAKLT